VSLLLALPLPQSPQELFELIEANRQLVYPTVALVTLGLIALGVLQALRSQDMDGLQKAGFKREIVAEMRKQVVGVTAEVLARKLGLEKFKTVRLLEEMQADGVLFSYNNTEHRQVWKLRGVGSSEPT
jgi:hypothetical protein